MRCHTSKERLNVIPAMLLMFLIAIIPFLSEGTSIEESREGGSSSFVADGVYISIGSTDEKTVYPLYPYNLTLTFEMLDPSELYLTFTHVRYSITIRGGFLRSFILDTSEAEGFLTIPQESVKLLSQQGSWMLNFTFIPHWEMAEGNYSLVLKLTNSTGGSREYLFRDAFYLSKKIMIYWQGGVLNERGEDVSRGWVRGREKITLRDIRLYHLKANGNVSSFYSRMKDFNFTLLSSSLTNWRWWIKDSVPFSGSFDLTLVTPSTTGILDCALSMDNLPDGATLSEDLTFKLRVDSKPPEVRFLGFEREGDHITFTFSAEDPHAGIDGGSISARVFRQSGDALLPVPGKVTYIDGTIRVAARDEGGGYYSVETGVEDTAGNAQKINITVIVSDGELYDIAVDGLRLLDLPVLNRSARGEVTIRNLGGPLTGGQLNVWLDEEIIYSKRLPSLSQGDVLRYTFSFPCGEEERTLKANVRILGEEVDSNLKNNELSMKVKGVFVDVGLREASAVEGEGKVRVNATVYYEGVETLPGIRYQVLYDEVLIVDGNTPAIQPGEETEISVSVFPSLRYSQIRIVLDPEGELPESEEGNNEVTLPNPCLIEEPREYIPSEDGGTTDDPLPAEEDSPGEEESQAPAENDRGVPQEGGAGTETPEGGSENDGSSGVENPPTGNEDVIMTPNVPDEEGSDGGVGLLLIVTQGAIGFFLVFEILRREALKYRLLTLFFPLYSKLKREKIESGIRWEILGYLKAKPYATFSDIKKDLGLTNGTLIHHLRILEREELVRSRKVGKYKVFYPIDRKMPEDFNYLSPVKRKILQYIMDHPGAVQKSIARLLGKSPTDLNYHLNELYRMGLIRKKREGKFVKYYPL